MTHSDVSSTGVQIAVSDLGREAKQVGGMPQCAYVWVAERDPSFKPFNAVGVRYLALGYLTRSMARLTLRSRMLDR